MVVLSSLTRSVFQAKGRSTSQLTLPHSSLCWTERTAWQISNWLLRDSEEVSW